MNQVELRTGHLDDDAFTEVMLGGEPSAMAQAHLDRCAECRAELARFQESVGGFNLATLKWSEEKSERLPALRPARAKVAAAWFYPAVSWGLAALLAIGVAVPVTMHFEGRNDLHAAADDDPSGLNSPEQIAKDNRLMAEVNDELIRSQRVLLSQYAGSGAGRGSGKAPGKRIR